MKAAFTRSALACAALMLLAAGNAAAAGASSEAQLRYRQERAACLNGQSNQERSTCLKEAGAALAQSRRDGLAGTDAKELERNRRTRCEALKGYDHDDCLRRMNGEGVTSGSARQGGIIRELARPE